MTQIQGSNIIHIKVQDVNNNWFIARTLNNVNEQYIFSQMKQMRSSYQTKRIKATDSDGRVLDIL